MNIESLLKYQAKDFEIFKLEKSLEDGNIKTLLSNAVRKSKQTQVKSLQLEKQAESLSSEFEALKKLYDQNLSSLTVLANTSYSDLSEVDLENYEKALSDLGSNISIIENKLQSLAKTINVVLLDFEREKQAYKVARQEYAKNKELYDEQQEKIKPQLEKLEKELKSIEKELEKEVIIKYKERRKDNRFPIFVPLSNDACGGCQMQLSYASINTLKEKHAIECENCRRVIYF